MGEIMISDVTVYLARTDIFRLMESRVQLWQTFFGFQWLMGNSLPSFLSHCLLGSSKRKLKWGRGESRMFKWKKKNNFFQPIWEPFEGKSRERERLYHRNNLQPISGFRPRLQKPKAKPKVDAGGYESRDYSLFLKSFMIETLN